MKYGFFSALYPLFKTKPVKVYEGNILRHELRRRPLF